MANRGGVDLGGTKIQTVIVDAKNKELGQAARGGAADAAGPKTSELSGIGVGSPGEIDPKTGAVSQARNLPGWEGTYPLAGGLGGGGRAPGAGGNDVQVATNAEVELG